MGDNEEFTFKSGSYLFLKFIGDLMAYSILLSLQGLGVKSFLMSKGKYLDILTFLY